VTPATWFRSEGHSFGANSSIGHPPHSSASPVELRLRVGPRALSEKKEKNLGNRGLRNYSVCLSVMA
jgi:hypothetical protein